MRREENIKLAILGLGGVGKELVRDLSKREGYEIVGVIARNIKQIGKDAGLLSDMGRPLGVLVTATTEQAKLFEEKKIDVLIHCAGVNNPRGTYELIKSALEHGINVITANVGTTDLWISDPVLAEEIDAVCKEHNVTYFGQGSSQVMERMVISMTEGSKDIESIAFTHHSDVHRYSAKSNRETLGIGLTKDEFDAREKEADGGEALNSNEESIHFMSRYLGWRIDSVSRRFETFVNDDDIVYGTHEVLIGYQEGKEKLREDWIFILDPDHHYYDRVVIHGTPEVDAVMNYSGDRGLCTTFATIRNAIPTAINSPAGYISSLSLPICNWFEGNCKKRLV